MGLGRTKAKPRILSSLTLGKWRRPRVYASHKSPEPHSVLPESGATCIVCPMVIDFATRCCQLFVGRRGVLLIGVASARGLFAICCPTGLDDTLPIAIQFNLGLSACLIGISRIMTGSCQWPHESKWSVKSHDPRHT
jgi:hypothetical protein